jgi:acetylornithine deacetylase/succinyl-diaminopimelate desuccinylase-like protein
MSGGYTGPGSKAVIPSTASARVNIRLVPDQQPDLIDAMFRKHIASLTPPTVTVNVRSTLGSNPVELDRRHPAMLAASRALSATFGSEPVFLRSGGSIPVVSRFNELGITPVMMGFALPDDNLHAPNEKFHLPNFYRGIEASIHFLAQISEGSHYDH